jgi:hypothetical protein
VLRLGVEDATPARSNVCKQGINGVRMRHGLCAVSKPLQVKEQNARPCGTGFDHGPALDRELLVRVSRDAVNAPAVIGSG